MKQIFKQIIALVIALIIPMSGITAYAEVQSITGWNPLLYGGAVGDVVIDTDEYYSGGASMKVVNYTPKTSNRYISVSTNISLVEGRKYYVGSWVKSIDTSSVFFTVNWGTRYSLLNFGSTFDWRNYEYVFTATQSGSQALMIVVEGTTAGIWFDDMRFIDSVTGENLLKNPTFDSGSTVSAGTAISGSDLAATYQKITTEKEFSEKDMQKVSGAFKYMPVYSAEGIEIDGQSGDWDSYPAFSMPTMESQYLELIKSEKEKDNTATAKFAYDEENFYIYLEVIDDKHVYFSGNDNYWRGDSVQLTISGVDEPYGSEIGFAHNPDTGKGEVYGTAFIDELLQKISVSSSNQNGKTIYEAAVPWNLKFDKIPEELLFCVIVNENDGDGRTYVLELSPGIATGKTNNEFPRLELMKGKKDWYGWVEGDRIGYTNTEHIFNCYVVNSGEGKNFTIKDIETGNVETVFIPEKSGIRHEVIRKYTEEGRNKVTLEISDGNETFTSSSSVLIELPPVNDEYTKNVIKVLNEQAKEIAVLLKECEDKGISTDYERANYTIMKIFPGELEKDIAAGDLIRVHYTQKTTNELYEKTKAALMSYLSGEKKSKVVSKYITSDMKINGQGLYATMEYDGLSEEKPIFYVGYGHFDRARNDIHLFPDLGMNIIQNETGPEQCLKNNGNGTGGHEYVFDKGSSGASLMTKILDKGIENDVAVCILISPHYFPQAAIDKYKIGGNSGFLKYNVNAPEAKVIMETYLRGIIPLIKDYDSLNSICITNEPEFHANTFPDFYTEDWQSFLKERYGKIEDLNAAYEAEFDDFTEINMDIDEAPAIKTYDMKLFNDKVFSEWHQWMVDIIKELAPDVPLHSKIIEHVSVANSWVQDGGVGYQNYHQMYDMNGCDAHRYYNNLDPLIKSVWYDYLTSMKNVSVTNTEDHIIPDGDQNFQTEKTYEEKKWVSEDVWQGAIHGRGQTILWVWARDYVKTSALNGSVLERPDALAAISETALDLNRLSYEVTALQEEPRDIGVLYSDSGAYMDDGTLSSIYDVYDALANNGKRPLFVVDSQSEKMHDMKLLIIPEVKHIPENTLFEIKRYIENGGKVLMLGKENLKKNERNLDNDMDLVNYIYANSQIVDYVAGKKSLSANMEARELAKIIRNALTEVGAYYIQILDAETNEPVYGVESNLGVYDEHLILNLDSYNSDKKVKIAIDGKIIDKPYDLRAEEEISGDVIDLEKYIPRIFRIEWDNTFVDTFGHWAEEDIKLLTKSDIVSGMSESRYAPQSKLTRAQFLALLTRAVKLDDTVYEGNVPDVEKGEWYTQNVAQALAAGIINAGENFRPSDAITREEMCDMLVKCYEKTKGRVENFTVANFTDMESVSDSISKAVALGLMYGYEDGSFSPYSGATRAEAAAVVARYLK